MNRSFWAPAVLVIVAGLILLLTAAAGWIGGVETRSVGEVVVAEPRSVSGTTFAPTAVVFGLAGLLVGVVLAVVRGATRRGVAVVALLLGVAGLAVVAAGISRARSADGPLTPAPIFAVVAAGGVAAFWRCAHRRVHRPEVVTASSRSDRRTTSGPSPAGRTNDGAG